MTLPLSDMPSQMYYFPALPSEPFRSVPFVAHAPPPPMFIPVPDPPLPTLLVNQIEYYFRYFDIVGLLIITYLFRSSLIYLKSIVHAPVVCLL